MPITNQHANSYSGRVDQHTWMTGLDLVKPVNASKMIDQYGNDEYMKELMWWKMQGVKKIVNNSDGWGWYNELPFNEKVVVKADASTATTTLIFTINTSYINTLGSQRSIYPREGDYLKDFGPIVNEGRISNIVDGGVDFTITANSITNTNWTAPFAGKEYAIYTYAEHEDSLTLPNPKDSYTSKDTAKLQRFAEQIKTTADVMTDSLWINQDENGNTISMWGDKQVMDCERRLAVQQVGAMWLGKYTTATGLPMTTQGAWDAFATGATTVNYTATTPTLAQVRTVIDNEKDNGVNGPQMWMLNKTAYRDFQSLWVSQGATTDLNVNQAALHSARLIFEDPIASSTDGLLRRFDTNTVVLDGVTINLRQMNISYDRSRVFGVDPTRNLFLTAGFVAPTARVKDGNGNPVGIIEVGYKSLGEYNLMGSTGGYFTNNGYLGWLTPGGPTDEQNNRRYGMRSFMGFGFRALQQCTYLQKA